MNDKMASLRSLQAADGAVLAALHAASTAGAWSAESFGRLLLLPGSFGQIAAACGRDAGFVLARAVAEDAEILAVAVVPARRRQGLGRLLMRAAAAEALAGGAHRLVLEVAAGNQAATALYVALGYQPIGRRAAYYARPGETTEDALVLALDLATFG